MSQTTRERERERESLIKSGETDPESEVYLCINILESFLYLSRQKRERERRFYSERNRSGERVSETERYIHVRSMFLSLSQ